MWSSKRPRNPEPARRGLLMVVSDPTRPKPVVLVIDDEPGVRESLRVLLEEAFEVIEAEAGIKGVEVLHSRRVDVVLLDVCMPGPPGPTFLPQILALDDAVAVIIITAVKDVRTAVEAIKGGAYDYVTELFGHEKGAFTGAHSRKLGKFELAHGGTIFLDEVGTMRVDLQAKLLRVLQEREIERLGGARPLPVDVRVIAATNVDLRQAVRARTFREDLFYRLNVVPLTIPPLRARKDDIPGLVEHFLRKYSREFKKDVRGISRGALPALMAYDWPGNVRELENIIERSVALATHPVVRLDDLPVDLAIHEVGQRPGDVGSEPLPLREARDRFEQAYFLRALERENWNQSRAARCLGIHRNTLIARMAAWGIRRVEEAKDLPEAAGEGT